MLYGDTVAIAATTAGVAGTINVPIGATLVGMNVSMTTVDAGIIASIKISWQGAPQPLIFVPGNFAILGTSGAGLQVRPTPLLPLNITVASANTVTITVTTTANETVNVGLMWTG